MALFTDSLGFNLADVNVLMDPVGKSMYLTGFDAMDVDASWEMTLTVLPDLFRQAYLVLVGFHSTSAATIPTPDANDAFRCRINRGSLELWRLQPALVTPAHFGGSLTGLAAQITSGLPPMPLFPGDLLILSGPTLDTNGTPTVDFNYQIGFVGVEG